MSVVSSFFQVRVVELSVLRVHSSVTVLPIFSITTRGFVIEIAVAGVLCFISLCTCADMWELIEETKRKFLVVLLILLLTVPARVVQKNKICSNN